MAITAEEKEIRKSSLFSSDIAQIMIGNSFEVALDKLGRLEKDEGEDSFDEKQEFKIGKIAEPLILDAYEQMTGAKLERNIGTIMHPAIPWMGCHQDARWPQRNVEAKTVRRELRHFWGEGGDQVNHYVLWQAVEQMAVSNTMVTDIPVCFLTLASVRCLLANEPPPITIFQIPRDYVLEEYMIQKASYIWDCIQKGTPPPPENLDQVKLIYPKAEDPEIEATPEIREAVAELLRYDEIEKAAKKAKDEYKLKVQLFMEKSKALVLKGGGQVLATWKNDRDGEKINIDALANDHPELVKQYIKPRLGARKFIPKRLKETQ